MVNEQLTPLERKALDVALSGGASWLEPLRLQVPRLRVVGREYTGVGFHTKFVCDGLGTANKIPTNTLHESPVAWASHPESAAGAEGAIVFSVFINDGVIDRLEGASVSKWPEREEEISFSRPQPAASVT